MRCQENTVQCRHHHTGMTFLAKAWTVLGEKRRKFSPSRKGWAGLTCTWTYTHRAQLLLSSQLISRSVLLNGVWKTLFWRNNLCFNVWLIVLVVQRILYQLQFLGLTLLPHFCQTPNYLDFSCLGPSLSGRKTYILLIFRATCPPFFHFWSSQVHEF